MALQARRLGFAALTMTDFPAGDALRFAVRDAPDRSGKCCRRDAKPFQGSARICAKRSGMVCNVNFVGSSVGFTSSQVKGVATVAPGRARGQNDATAVAPMPLRNQSIRILPRRSTFRSV